MADSPASTMLENLVPLVWNCLSQPVHKNGLYKQLFFDKVVLSDVASAASLCFAPDLLETIQAREPPEVNFFKTLPSDARKRWGVYALVLEKTGCDSLVYIGSGTEARRGVLMRWHHYDKPDTYEHILPNYVRDALKEGYTVTHKGLLVWTSLPPAEHVPIRRLLFVAIETTLSFLFWTMHSTSKDYGIGSCCLWPRDSFSYLGLCSHNALLEMVLGDFDLSAEQLEALAADIREKNRLYQANYYQNLKTQDPEGLAARMREADLRYRQNSHDKSIEKGRRYSKNAKASRRF